MEVSEDELYIKLKNLQRQLEFLAIQEEYIKDEQKNLKRELLRLIDILFFFFLKKKNNKLNIELKKK